MNHNLVRVSSDFKMLPTMSNSNFAVAYNNTQLMQSISSVVMNSCDIPNVFPNINNTGYNFSNSGNDVFILSDKDGNLQTLNVPVGQYTITQLLGVINTFIANLAAPYTPANGVQLSLNPITNKIQVNNNTAGQLFGLPYSTGFTMAPYIGLTFTINTIGTSSASLQDLPNLAGIQEVYITSQKVSNFSNLVVADGIQYPCILNVQMDVPFGQFAHYKAQNPEIDDIEYGSITQGVNLQVIDIQLRDRWGNILDLQGLPFNLIMKVYHGHSN
jgi:hypothetical protein